MKKERFNIAIVGLGFGAEFIPIYQNYPGVRLEAICMRGRDKLDKIGDAFGIKKRYTDYYELIKDDDIDAVHINTPVLTHAEFSIAALKSGKHVACTIPMAVALDDCMSIVRAKEESNKIYMMMETAVYTREFLFVKELRDTGKLGRIQFLRGSHLQEMAGWPEYWMGFPPMHNATHAVSPMLAIAQKEAAYVSCYGSGRLSQDLITRYGSPFAVESAHIRLKDSDISAEVTRSLFETSREYIESFDVYADKMSFEWQRTEKGQHIVFTGEEPHPVTIPDYAHLLPESISQYTTKGVYDAKENIHLSFVQGSGHGGSHPHLVHEFISALKENREPFPDVYTAANWTSAGICAHISAMNDGEKVDIPDYMLKK